MADEGEHIYREVSFELEYMSPEDGWVSIPYDRSLRTQPRAEKEAGRAVGRGWHAVKVVRVTVTREVVKVVTK